MSEVNKRRSRGAETISSKNPSHFNMKMMQSDDEIDLVELFFRLLDHWFLIALIAILGAVLMGVYSFRIATPIYEATSKLYVLNNKDSAINVSDLQISSQLTNDYKEVFDNWHVHELVLQQTGLPYSYEELSRMLSIHNPANTRIIAITTRSSNAEEAKLLADTYANVAREFITVKMETQTPSVFEEALLPVEPISPKKMRNVLIGFMAGFLLAAGIITVRFLMDDYIRTPDDIEKATGLPVLGTMMFQNEKQIRKEIAKMNRKKGENRNENDNHG